MNGNVPPAPSASILLVDDTPANLHLLGGLLRQLGFSVRLATSCPLALEAARRLPPDLILLDVRMPGMNGYELCALMKADAELKHIPVIFISALGETEDKVKAFRVGGADYVTKPFQVEEVEARVRTHLENHRLQQELVGHKARLEGIVRERTRQLAETNARLAQLDQAKTDFLTVISHELRTPLSILLGVTELLFAEFPGLPQILEYRKMFESSHQRLLRLVDDALLLSSMQVGDAPLASEAVPLTEVVAEAVAEARAGAAERQVQIDPAPSTAIAVAGDRFFLTKALARLLETGVRFSKPGRKLVMETHATAETVSLLVKADGYSVPAEALPRFFDVLAIGKTLTPEGDLGLSPAVAAQIIRLLGGRVEIANGVLPGIQLSAFLPRSQTDPSAPPDGDDGGKSSQRV